ncbi:hypothetical protein BBC27_09665 [Acidithiobacillus ferrivorans]|uniref:Uncharacterized protein n=1 Tax=Acidithiobacillus ferrivorans TaxID=160808 RepID=A0A1B9BZG2_9PROT|nr:hypothetical protein [Acidithiobacillus ferrivorans]OCB03106.1 hypothetical protein BBC27_09665 [Acidithiobacillus ferrivorans]
MSKSSMAYSIAHDIHDEVMTKEEAIAEFGHIIDVYILDELLAALDGAVTVEDDRTIIRGDFERTW